MAISIGANTIWQFFVNGVPASGKVLRFYKNSDRKITKPAYLDPAGVNQVTELTLDENGYPGGYTQLYFDDTGAPEDYYIKLTEEDDANTVYWEIQGYVPIGGGGGGTSNAFFIDYNHVPNPQFYYHPDAAFSITDDTEIEIAPPSWLFKQTLSAGTSYPTATLTYEEETTGSTTIGAQADSTPTYYLRYNKTGAGANEQNKRIYFKIPTCRAFAGETIQFRMDVRGSAAYSANIFYEQNMGTGGGAGGSQGFVTLNAVNITNVWSTVTTSPVLITALPGLTIDDDTDYVVFGIDLVGLNSITGTFDMTNVQLFIGSQDIQYVYSDPQYDNAMSLPIPAKGPNSLDAGKKLVVNGDGYYELDVDESSLDNLIWGGDFTANPWQEGDLTGLTADLAYLTDGYQLTMARDTNTNEISSTKFLDAPTSSDTGYNYKTYHSLRATIATAAYTHTNNTRLGMRHIIEAQDMLQLEGKKAVLGFWLKVNRAAAADFNFAVMLSSAGQTTTSSDFYYSKQLIATADNNTWQKFVIPIDTINFNANWNANDSTKLNLQGLYIDFIFDAGSAFANAGIVEDTWTAIPAANAWVDAAITNSFAIGDYVSLALPQLHEGDILPSFPDQTEADQYKKAKRYYERTYEKGTPTGTAGVPVGYTGGIFSNAGTACFPQDGKFDELKRITPSVVTYSTNSATANRVRQVDDNFNPNGGTSQDKVSSAYVVSRQALSSMTITSGGANFKCVFHWVANARF